MLTPTPEYRTHMTRRAPRGPALFRWLVLLAACGLPAAFGYGQAADAPLDALEGVGIDQKLDAQIPLDLTFRDSSGKTLPLREIFSGQRPVLLSLNYSNCPMLCQLQLTGLVEGLREVNWTAGQEFTVVSVSIDPLETTTRAEQTKQRYLKEYGRPGAGAGWHFLTGDKASIAQLADTVGFRFKYIADRNEYVHAAALMVCTPQGRVSRYLLGVQFEPQTLKLSMLEAGEGKIGSPLDQFLLFCFHYDAEAGRYGPSARRLMQLAASVTLVMILGGLVPVWLRRRRGHAGPATGAASAPAAEAAPAETPAAAPNEK